MPRDNDNLFQAEVERLLGLPAGVFAGWRRRGIGPQCTKLDHQQPYSYARDTIEAMRAALLGIGMYGLKLHGASSPLLIEGSTCVSREVTEPLTSEGEMLMRLGISKPVASKWRTQAIGPRFARVARRIEYQANDVTELRNHLLDLGRFGIGLPGLPALKP